MRFALGLGFWLISGGVVAFLYEGEAAAGYGFFTAVFGSFVTLLALEHFSPKQEV
ncbi:MAG: hypothetical protein JXK05_08260 [Campylobacterales bacterium]|nr:hypothetical protein [Campylobacterales bacterium]